MIKKELPPVLAELDVGEIRVYFATVCIVTLRDALLNFALLPYVTQGWNSVYPHPHRAWLLTRLPNPLQRMPIYGVLAATPCLALSPQGVVSETPRFPRPVCPYMELCGTDSLSY